MHFFESKEAFSYVKEDDSSSVQGFSEKDHLHKKKTFYHSFTNNKSKLHCILFLS